jgi:hypothetical protein
MPNLLPVLLPWLVALGLLALPSNRNARAWWIWAPLVVVALLGFGVEAAFDAESNDGLSYIVQAVCAAGFGLTAIWLLGAGLARRCRALGIVLVALAFAAVSLLAFAVSPAGEQMRDLSGREPLLLLYLLLFWIAGGLVYAGALNLTGRMCRKRFTRVRVSLRLPFWLWVMWIVAGGLLGGVVTLVSGSHFDWPDFAVGSVVLTLVSFGVILPFLILSFACPFYRDRLKSLLRLPPPETASAAATPLPVAERQVASP